MKMESMKEAGAASERESLRLSPSVRSAASRFSGEESVSAAALAQAVLELHRSDYAGGKASSLSLGEGPANGTKYPVQDWLEEIRILFDSSLAPELHGRLVIIGLSLLDPHLRGQLQQHGFLAALEQELKEPLDELLTVRGQALRLPADTVPNQPDDPLQEIEEDQLGRAAFARYLARRIFAIPPGSRAYSIHLYGPWGSGKSTLLNFLEKELESSENRKRYVDGPAADEQPGAKAPEKQSKAEDQGWLVVPFNAWQHQHIQPPWWALMDRVFQESKKELRFRHLLSEYWWRLSSGRLALLLGIAVLAWLLAIFLPQLLGDTPPDSDPLSHIAGIADAVGKILALIVTIWAGIQAVSEPLFLRTARAAKSYTEVTGDPMNEIKRRFKRLIERIPKRVAIFIDDLDRCQSTYVVDLLEGIQTLFREAPVVFVVAADRRWLNACYETVYDDLKLLVRQPGKPLGVLFLEKAFQFSTSVPSIPEELKEEYWQNLIQVQSDGAAGLETAREKARQVMAETENEAGILAEISRSRNHSFSEQRAIREEAVKRLAAPEILERTEHVLKPLASLLDPNPRAMKRLVNAYSANRALATLAHVDIERDQLALWTILSLRWPQLVEHLEAHPEIVEKIDQWDVADAPKDLQGLLNAEAEEVINVIAGKSVHATLDQETIKRCARLRS